MNQILHHALPDLTMLILGYKYLSNNDTRGLNGEQVKSSLILSSHYICFSPEFTPTPRAVSAKALVCT